jgi:PAS domain-containing protein
MVSPARGKSPQFLRRVKNRPALRRRNRLHAMIRAVVVVGIISALAYGVYFAYQQALTTPRLALQRVVLHQVPTPLIEQVREKITPHYGQNLLALNLEELQTAVESIPEVRSASVRRTLPDGLVVRVESRLPKALLQTADGTYVIDRDGVVISASEADMRQLTTVRMEGIGLHARRGQTVVQTVEFGARVADAITVLEWFEQSQSGLAPNINHLRIDEEGIVVVLTQPELEILLGDAQSLAAKIEGVEALLVSDRPAGPVVVDARYRDMLLVRDLPVKSEPHEEKE